MTKLNRQATFNKVATHLLSMRCRALKNGSCAYRSRRGNRCAIGCLIPDEMYNNKMEYKIVDYIFSEISGLFAADVNPGFLSSLQQIHDCHDKYAWRYMLVNFARVNNLSDEVLKNGK